MRVHPVKVLAAALVTVALGASSAQAASAPAQPTTGPGGADYPHGDWIVSQGGSGNEAWYVFQPASPRPQSAPVSILLHGFGEFSGYASMQGLIRHLVRKGYVVVYPRWQTGFTNPDPFAFEPTLTAATAGVKGALAWLQADSANRVQPQLDKVGYLGHSYGGMIAADMANRHASLGVPVPKSLFLYEPVGGTAGDHFDPSMSGVPASAKVVCQISQGFTDTTRGCFTLFPKFTQVPVSNKDFVTMYSDSYGDPDLIANHESICSPPNAWTPCYTFTYGATTDAMDFYGLWKPSVALQACANSGALCDYGLNDTANHRFMGTWSDGTRVREMRITDTAIAP